MKETFRTDICSATTGEVLNGEVLETDLCDLKEISYASNMADTNWWIAQACKYYEVMGIEVDRMYSQITIWVI